MTKYKTIFRLSVFITTFFVTSTYGQKTIDVKKVEVAKLPKGIKYEGKVKSAIRWTDSLGDNIVITTETGVHNNKKLKHENDGSDAELFAYRFLIKKDSVKQVWRVYDFIADCIVDLEATFLKNTLQVTDLNDDGVGEIWLVYKKVCHGDISAYDMKIVMYQGQDKFAMRGRNKVFVGSDDKGNKQYDGGEYKFDEAFENGPTSFKDFAKKLWDKNVMQTY